MPYGRQARELKKLAVSNLTSARTLTHAEAVVSLARLPVVPLWISVSRAVMWLGCDEKQAEERSGDLQTK